MADDSRGALELVNTVPLHTRVLVHVPPDPLRTVSPTAPLITDEDRTILQECLRSHNDWLFNLAAVWLSEDPDDENIATLWDVLPHILPSHRFPLGCWLLTEMDRREVYKEWLGGNDNILRLAAARMVGEIGTDKVGISSLVQSADLMVRLEVLHGLKERNHFNQIRIYAQLVVNVSPTEWTCKSCGSIEPIAEWNCTRCAASGRPDLHKGVQELLKKLPRQ